MGIDMYPEDHGDKKRIGVLVKKLLAEKKKNTELKEQILKLQDQLKKINRIADNATGHIDENDDVELYQNQALALVFIYWETLNYRQEQIENKKGLSYDDLNGLFKA